MITTKRHPFKFHLAVAFILLAGGGLGVFMIYRFIALVVKDGFEPVTFVLFLTGVALLLLGFYFLRWYLSNAPVIRLDENTISFGEEAFPLADITNIRLTGKMPARGMGKFRMEGTALEFNDGTVKYIYNDMYTNAWQLQAFLQKTVLEKQVYRAPNYQKISRNTLRFEQMEEFKGNQFTSFRGISLWAINGFFCLWIISMDTPPTSLWIFLIVFCSSWFFINSWAMHYFSLSKDYLVVKNHNLRWRLHIYRLNDIREIAFESQGRSPDSLRVITKDYRNKLFPAGTLRDKHWRRLQNALEKEGIRVRNELYARSVAQQRFKQTRERI